MSNFAHHSTLNVSIKRLVLRWLLYAILALFAIYYMLRTFVPYFV